jgi:hypothetical protein
VMRLRSRSRGTVPGGLRTVSETTSGIVLCQWSRWCSDVCVAPPALCIGLVSTTDEGKRLEDVAVRLGDLLPAVETSAGQGTAWTPLLERHQAVRGVLSSFCVL